MTKTEVLNKVTRTFHKAKFKVKKHSPEILVVSGVVGVVASTVMACKATTKLSTILDKAKEDIDTIHEVIENPEKYPDAVTVGYTEEDSKKDITIVYAKTGVELVKMYAPAVALGVLSLGCIVKSHDIMRKRNLALAAAYTAIDKSFKGYRGRVIERFGKELDRELRYNIKAKEIEEKFIDENGEEQTVKKTVDVIDERTPNDYSPYCIVFDDGNAGWSKDPEATKYFLLRQQDWANEKLKAQGYLFLNDVYKMLGAPITQAGAHVGWMYDEKNPTGDNYVDFGMFDIHREKARDFINGREKVIVLDFNVDGDILSNF